MLSDWYIVVSGEPTDIGLLQDLLQASTGHAIEFDEQTRQWRLRSTRLAGIPTHDPAREMAQDLLTELADAAAATADTRVKLGVGSMGRTRPDGNSDVFVYAGPIMVRARAFPPTVLINGQVVGEPRAGRLLCLQAANPHLRLALHFLNLQETWFDLYKAFEAIAEGNGGSARLIAKGWATRNTIRRFTGTANTRAAVGDAARHAQLRRRPPANPMTIGEAEEFVRGLLANWLTSLP